MRLSIFAGVTASVLVEFIGWYSGLDLLRRNIDNAFLLVAAVAFGGMIGAVIYAEKNL